MKKSIKINILTINCELNNKNVNLINSAINVTLNNFYKLNIGDKIDLDKYQKNTKSKFIKRSVKILRKEENIEKEMVLQYHNNNYISHPLFSNIKQYYITYSIYKNKYVIVWLNFHRKLLTLMDSNYQNFISSLAERISFYLKTTTFYMYSTSFSRNDDKFQIYNKGILKTELAEKDILTVVKNEYGLSVNDMLTHIDNTVAKAFAPIDYMESSELVNTSKKKLEYIVSNVDKLKENVSETELANQIRDHEMILKKHEANLKNSFLLMTEPTDELVLFFELTQYTKAKNNIDEDEYYFG